MNQVEDNELQKSQKMALELGIPIRISIKSVIIIQIIFTVLAASVIFYFAPALYSRTVLTRMEVVAFLVAISALLIAAFFAYSTSDAVIIKGQLRIKNILVKPRYIDLLKVNKVWIPLSSNSRVAVIFYHGFVLFPPFSIIIIPNWIPNAASLKKMLLYGQELSATITRPENKFRYQG